MGRFGENGKVLRQSKGLVILAGLITLFVVTRLFDANVCLCLRCMCFWRNVFLPVLAVALFFIQIVIYINRRIFLYPDHLIYRTFLRKTYEIPYRNIKGYTRKRWPGWRIYVYTDETMYKLRVDSVAETDIDELEKLLAAHVSNDEQ